MEAFLFSLGRVRVRGIWFSFVRCADLVCCGVVRMVTIFRELAVVVDISVKMGMVWRICGFVFGIDIVIVYSSCVSRHFSHRGC